MIILIFRIQIYHVALLFLFLNGTQRPQNSVTGNFSAQCFWKYMRRINLECEHNIQDYELVIQKQEIMRKSALHLGVTVADVLCPLDFRL